MPDLPDHSVCDLGGGYTLHTLYREDGSILTKYRARLVQFGPPQMYHFSKVDDPCDWGVAPDVEAALRKFKREDHA